jgi:hypothetical protein
VIPHKARAAPFPLLSIVCNFPAARNYFTYSK